MIPIEVGIRVRESKSTYPDVNDKQTCKDAILKKRK